MYMQILNYGLFWRRNEVDWNPGKGKDFELLGRIGVNRPNIQIADFRLQQGIYILYNSYGPYYVGLANAGGERRGLGDRLREHTTDAHKYNWDRFSWFGFKRVCITKKNSEGISRPQVKIATTKITDPSDAIKNVEALLIRAMGCYGNTLQMNFTDEEKWEQIELYNRNYYVSKLNQ